MNVEMTIQRMYDKFPKLFKNRADCYNRLFCEPGNGYEWSNGELVPKVVINRNYTPEEVERVEAKCIARFENGRAFQHKLMSIRDEKIASLLDKLRADPNYAFKINWESIDNAPDDKYHMRERARRWYFYNDISNDVDFCADRVKLFNPPPDIKPDWAAAIEECKEMLREDGYDVDSVQK